MKKRLYSQLAKAISITIVLATILPMILIVPAQQRPTLRTDRQRYAPSEKVVVYFSGLPAGNDYQVTIVTPTHSDNAYGTWYPTEGKAEGVMEDFRSGGDGVYEVRIISLNPDSTRTVHARHIFTVGSAVYTPPAKPSPQKSPEPAARPQVSGADVLKQQPSSGTPATQVSSEQVKAMSLQSTDDLAVKLAEQVVRGGSKAKPALVMALQSAGFGVQDKGELIAAPMRPSQSAGFSALDVDIMTQQVLATPLRELSYDLAFISAGKKPSPPEVATFAAAVIETIRSAATDSRSTIRFWGRFIAELGRQSTVPYDLMDSDLLSKVEANNIALSAIQSSMLLRHVSGQLFLGADKELESSRSSAKKTTFYEVPKNVMAWSGEAAMPFSFAMARYFPPTPSKESRKNQDPFYECRHAQWFDMPPDHGSIFLSSMIRLLRKGFEERPVDLDEQRAIRETKDFWGGKPSGREYIDKLEDAEKEKNEIWKEKFKKIGRAMNAAALILSLTEMIITYNALKFEFQMEGSGPPLVRTTNPRPQPGGQQRPISMKLRVELGNNVQLINCFRLLVNLFGVDFKLPNSGAMEGVGVEWLIVEGGGLDWASSYLRKQEGSEELVQWTAGFKPNQKTNTEGISRVTIEGTPQRRYLTGKVLPVMKSATVRTNIQLKPADIFRDTGDALRGPWVVLAELIYRTRWFSSDFTFPVKDWEPCNGGWYGTIRFSGSRSTSDGGKKGRGEAGSKASRESSWSSQQTTSYEATIQVMGEQMRNRSSYQKARVEATASYYWKSEKSVSEDNYCGEGRTSRDTATSTFIKEGQVTDSGDDLGNVDVYGNKYKIVFSPPKRVIEGPITVTSKSTGGPCGTDLGTSTNSTEQMRFDHVIQSIEGTIDPRDPDRLKGSKVVETTSYGPVTITWDLTRCGRSSP